MLTVAVAHVAGRRVSIRRARGRALRLCWRFCSLIRVFPDVSGSDDQTTQVHT